MHKKTTLGKNSSFVENVNKCIWIKYAANTIDILWPNENEISREKLIPPERERGSWVVESTAAERRVMILSHSERQRLANRNGSKNLIFAWI